MPVATKKLGVQRKNSIKNALREPGKAMLGTRWGAQPIVSPKSSLITDKQKLQHVRDLFKYHVEDAVAVTLEIMMDRSCIPMARLEAVKILLDRGYGKPEQSINLVEDNDEHRARMAEVWERAVRNMEIMSGAIDVTPSDETVLEVDEDGGTTEILDTDDEVASQSELSDDDFFDLGDDQEEAA
jgi:hypothetical protein